MKVTPKSGFIVPRDNKSVRMAPASIPVTIPGVPSFEKGEVYAVVSKTYDAYEVKIGKRELWIMSADCRYFSSRERAVSYGNRLKSERAAAGKSS